MTFDDYLLQLPPDACIVFTAAGGGFYDIVIENRKILGDFANVTDAVMYCFAYHYVFNMKYSATFTYDFLQRYVVKIGLTDLKAPHRVKNLSIQLHL